jgi:hypothetical protein
MMAAVGVTNTLSAALDIVFRIWGLSLSVGAATALNCVLSLGSCLIVGAVTNDIQNLRLRMNVEDEAMTQQLFRLHTAIVAETKLLDLETRRGRRVGG